MEYVENEFTDALIEAICEERNLLSFCQDILWTSETGIHVTVTGNEWLIFASSGSVRLNASEIPANIIAEFDAICEDCEGIAIGAFRANPYRHVFLQ